MPDTLVSNSAVENEQQAVLLMAEVPSRIVRSLMLRILAACHPKSSSPLQANDLLHLLAPVPPRESAGCATLGLRASCQLESKGANSCAN
jgi:hypothetical protein